MKPQLAALMPFALAAFVLAAPVPKDFQKPTGFHPLAVGDKREYVSPTNPDVVTQTREITAVEEKDGVPHFTQTLSTGQTSVLKTDKAGAVWMAAQNGQALDAPYKVIGPGLKEGDKWEQNDGTGAIRTVGKAEKITVPFGTLTATPITVSYPDQAGSEVVVWYAEGVGLVRLDSGGRPSIVLKKFTPGRAK